MGLFVRIRNCLLYVCRIVELEGLIFAYLSKRVSTLGTELPASLAQLKSGDDVAVLSLSAFPDALRPLSTGSPLFGSPKILGDWMTC